MPGLQAKNQCNCCESSSTGGSSSFPFSSSSGFICQYTWRCTYNCDTERWSIVTMYDTACGPQDICETTDWGFLFEANDICTYERKTCGPICADDLTCLEAVDDNRPIRPTHPFDCPCPSSNAPTSTAPSEPESQQYSDLNSSDQKCLCYVEITYDTIFELWSVDKLEELKDDWECKTRTINEPLDTWIFDGESISGVCTWHMWSDDCEQSGNSSSSQVSSSSGVPPSSTPPSSSELPSSHFVPPTACTGGGFCTVPSYHLGTTEATQQEAESVGWAWVQANCTQDTCNELGVVIVSPVEGGYYWQAGCCDDLFT